MRDSALRYHRLAPAGKLSVTPTKPLENRLDLSQAYSPGVAFPCQEIVADPLAAATYTARSNLVGVITNGSAVLGLGNIGPLAAKPVMEGKSVLFKRFANIDAFDIEVDEPDPVKLVEVIAALAPTFGAINLEDIKAPDCFAVEAALEERLDIPVFHDDQHGTAIVVAAAVRNGLELVGKRLDGVRVVATGGGAASIACLNLLVDLGMPVEAVTLVDIEGVVYTGRTADMNPYKSRYARETTARTLDEVIDGADVFLGLSAPGVLTAAMLMRMAPDPLVYALANPVPEILPEVAAAARPDAVIATGRSDYPNQVNNVLCFPFIFRGALDVGATTINRHMQAACVEAIAELAKRPPSEEVEGVDAGSAPVFSREYLIPKPFDPRLYVEVSLATARAAMESGVATRPIADLDAYRRRLRSFNTRSQLFMQPEVDLARRCRERLVYAEGENPTVLRTVQAVLSEGLAEVKLVGRVEVVKRRLAALGSNLEPGRDFEIIDPQDDPRYRDYWETYHELTCRRGVSKAVARTVMRTSATAIAACMLVKGDADAMICGTEGRYDRHLRHVIEIVGPRAPDERISSVSVLLLPQGPLFVTDPYIDIGKRVDDVVATALAAADRVRNFGVVPKVALLSHSNFGSSRSRAAQKMRDATRRLQQLAPELEVEGEMHANAALDEAIRETLIRHSRLHGTANLLVMPTLDAANIAVELLRSVTKAVLVGPLLMGTAMPAHIATASTTSKGLFNMSAVAVADAWRAAHPQRAAAGGHRRPPPAKSGERRDR
ncbi:MAG TPA: NADP-dependent malic enzyme [Woeseiaceae bacterium]|nr:NADP-dependent malic enzyme [Woeseiaceae bacterium]